MFATRLSVFVWLAALAAATSVSDFVVHEALVAAPQGFTNVGPASPDQTLTLRLALAQTDPDGMIQSLMDISTPGNALYGRQFTKEEVRHYIRNNAFCVD